VSGPYGWAGVSVLLAAVGGETVAVFGIMAAAFSNDLGNAVPWFILFLVSVPLTAAGGWLWQQRAKRRGDAVPFLLIDGAFLLICLLWPGWIPMP
jgi:hypothetical protein